MMMATRRDATGRDGTLSRESSTRAHTHTLDSP